MYEMSAQLQGLRFVGVPLTRRLRARRGGDARGDRAHRPALTYIAYPNNPTAQPVRRRASIERIVAAVGAQDGLVVIDEAYQPFSSRDLDAAPGARIAHVLVMRTLSKFGLAGVRLGYLAGAARADRADRQGAPAVQHQRAERRGDAVRARARRRVRAAGGGAARRARAAAGALAGAAGRRRRSRARPT